MVCSHREHAAIDLALARGVSVTAIGRRYKISTDSLYRHRANHLPPTLRAQLIAGPDLDIDLDRLKETESQYIDYSLPWMQPRNMPTATCSRAWLAPCTPTWN